MVHVERCKSIKVLQGDKLFWKEVNGEREKEGMETKVKKEKVLKRWTEYFE